MLTDSSWLQGTPHAASHMLLRTGWENHIQSFLAFSLRTPSAHQYLVEPGRKKWLQVSLSLFTQVPAAHQMLGWSQDNLLQGLYWFMSLGLFPQILLLITSLRQGWKIQPQIILLLPGNPFNHTIRIENSCPPTPKTTVLFTPGLSREGEFAWTLLACLPMTPSKAVWRGNQ